MMKNFLKIILIMCAVSAPSVVRAESVKGGFEIAAFFDAGMGFQHFSNAPPTEIANDGSVPGVLGELIPGALIPTSPGEDIFEAYVETFEIDITKSFGDRAKLRADILFGRPNSGSWVTTGTSLEQAYGAATLWKEHGLELMLGRFGSPIGFEPFEPHLNDVISWSILSRANLYPTVVTGAQLSFNISEHLSLFLAAVNGLTDDSTFKINDTPSWYASLKYKWGDEARESFVILSPYFGPDSGSDDHYTVAGDITGTVWVTKDLNVGFETLFRRDFALPGSDDTDYAAALLDVKWELRDDIYAALKYSFAKQFDYGNGYYDLTGDKQDIHEISLGGAYWITDAMKFKLEGRFDIIDPADGPEQYVPGVAIAMSVGI